MERGRRSRRSAVGEPKASRGGAQRIGSPPCSLIPDPIPDPIPRARAAAIEAQAAVTGERDAALSAELAQIRAELALKMADLDANSAERDTLRGDLAVSDAALMQAESDLAEARDAAAEQARVVEEVEAKRAEAVASVESLTVRLAEAEAALVDRISVTARQSEQVAEATAREAEQAAEARAAAERQALAEAQLSGVVEDRDRAIAQAQEAEARISRGRGAMVSAHRALYQDAMSRLIEREIDRILGSRSSANKLRTVMGPFYDRHLELVTRDLVPLLRVHLSFTRRDEAPETLASDLAEQHIARSKSDLAEVYEADADEFPAQLSRMIQRWRDKRTNDLAEYLMRREIEHG